MDRNSKRARIQAARDWLGQADDSLERSDELQGDLKLMLAKAELEGAAPGRKTRRLRKWLSRGAALAVAVLIVLALENWPLRQEPVQENISPQPPTVEMIPENNMGEVQEKNTEADNEVLPLPSGGSEEEAEAAQPVPVQGNDAGSAGPFEAGSPQSAVSPHLTYTPPRVPSPDTQNLMQKAGEILRR